MATVRQQRLAKAIVKNSTAPQPLNKQELVASSGYTVAQADKKATEIIESKGTQEALEELGFDTESAKKVVKRILTRGKEENQLKAADMIFKVNDEYAAEKHINLNVDVQPTPRLKQLADKLNQK